MDLNSLAKIANYSIVASAFAISLPTPFIGLTTSIFFLCWLVLAIKSDAANTINVKQIILQNNVNFLIFTLWSVIAIAVLWSSASLADALHIFGKYKILLLTLLMLTITRENTNKQIIFSFFAGYIFSLICSYIHWTNLITLPIGSISGFHTHIQFSTLESFVIYMCSILLIYTKKWSYRIFYATIVTATAFNFLFINNGRTGYIVFGCLTLLLTFFYSKWKGIIAALLLLALLSFSLYEISPNFHNRINNSIEEAQNTTKDLENENIGSRTVLWLKALSIIKQHPIFGAGTGSYPTEYKAISHGSDSHNPHQQFLLIWAEQGLLGLVVLLLLFYAQWKSISEFHQPYRYLAYGFMTTFLVHSLFNSALMDSLEGHFYALMTVAFWSDYKT